MRLNYTKPYSFFKVGIFHSFFFLILIPTLTQKEGCKPKPDQPPSPTTLIYPVKGDTDIPLSVELKWKAAEGNPEGYRVKVGTSSNEGDVMNYVDVGNNTSCRVGPLPANTTIYVTVTPYNNVGPATGCKEENFTTLPPQDPYPPDTLPECTALSSPADGAVDVALDGDLSWRAAAGADGYKIRIGTTSGAGDIQSTVDVGNATTFDPGTLPVDKTIFVTVTPYNSAGEATSCPETSFSTEPGSELPQLGCTELAAPADGDTDVPVNVRLSWQAAPGSPAGYRISVGTGAGQADLHDKVDVGNVTSFDPGLLPNDATLFVTITPYNSAGDADGCDEESFTTAASQNEEPRYVRKNVNDLAPDDPVLLTYRKGIEEMKKLPDSDPHSWVAQANIHRDNCVHGSWFFLPWHRAYLYHFEEIIRKVTGDNDFALPYWDWNDPREIPAAFWGSGNSMEHPRNASQGQTVANWVVTPSEVDDLMDEPVFTAFAGQPGRGAGLELPHNNVHVWVGADMSDVAMAAQDPLFWCHHANVDRLWAMWNENGNANTDNSSWLNQVFTNHFFDRNKQPISAKVDTLVSTYAMDYRYDTQMATEPETAIGVFPITLEPMEGMLFNTERTEASPLNQSVDLRFQATEAFFVKMKEIASQSEEEATGEMVLLYIDGISPPKEENVLVSVFLNQEGLNQDTPLEGPYYVDSFGFFLTRGGHQHEGHGGDDGQSVNYGLDLTPTLRKMAAINKLPDDEFIVQLLAVSLSGEGSGKKYVPGKFTLLIVNPEE